jgi:hypothetical protein
MQAGMRKTHGSLGLPLQKGMAAYQIGNGRPTAPMQ